jgi:hypothetical protein
MDDQFQMQQDGTELTPEDLNGLGEVSGLGDDRLLADLVQLIEGSGPAAEKGVFPYAAAVSPGSPTTYSGLVQPSAVGNGSVYVLPFRAAVGAHIPGVDPQVGLRTGKFVGVGPVEPIQLVTLDDTVTNNRVDLIYARVDVDLDAATVTREIKSATGSISTQSVSVIKNTVVSLAVAKGTETASPTRPNLPADADPVFYIPLAYIWLTHPHTSSSTIVKRQIEEVAPFLGANHGRMGTANAGPCVQLYGTAFHANDPWTVSHRPEAFLASSMGGMVHRWVGLDQENQISVPISTSLVLDDSIDWRNRLFWSRVQGRKGGASVRLAWADATLNPGEIVPSDEEDTANTLSTFEGFGQSFQDDGAFTGDFGQVVYVTNSEMACMTGASALGIHVNLGTGALEVETNGTGAVCSLFFWIMATGQMKLGGP